MDATGKIKRYRRFKGWDYAKGASLFITIATEPRRALFGRIVNGALALSPLGEKVKEAVEKYYRGVAANLTLIEVTLFDHCLIYKRNSHTPLVRSLIAWGILGKMSEVEVKKLSNLMASKYQEIPKGGYKVWDKYHENDKTLCADIGANLGPTIPYRIELGK